MKPIDFVLIVLLVIVILAAVFVVVKNRGRCYGCEEDCASCSKVFGVIGTKKGKNKDTIHKTEE